VKTLNAAFVSLIAFISSLGHDLQLWFNFWFKSWGFGLSLLYDGLESSNFLYWIVTMGDFLELANDMTTGFLLHYFLLLAFGFYKRPQTCTANLEEITACYFLKLAYAF
jgi:hypothetical protein